MKTLCTYILLSFAWPLLLAAQEWTLVWGDEFNGDGRPDSTVWNYEQGFVRNHEAQWYQAENAFQEDGLLLIEARRFHIWRMDWDETAICLYLDDELLNEVPLSTTVNGRIGNYTNPFHRPQYFLLNLALGGDNGGAIDDAALPMRYEIDYVRVYSS